MHSFLKLIPKQENLSYWNTQTIRNKNIKLDSSITRNKNRKMRGKVDDTSVQIVNVAACWLKQEDACMAVRMSTYVWLNAAAFENLSTARPKPIPQLARIRVMSLCQHKPHTTKALVGTICLITRRERHNKYSKRYQNRIFHLPLRHILKCK